MHFVNYFRSAKLVQAVDVLGDDCTNVSRLLQRCQCLVGWIWLGGVDLAGQGMEPGIERPWIHAEKH